MKSDSVCEENSQAEVLQEYYPLSGKPRFNVVLTKSNVEPSYVLRIPEEFIQMLPSSSFPVVLTHRGKNWNMVYLLSYPKQGRFDRGWRAFVGENDLKFGDVCLFELIESENKGVKFKVLILRGKLPSDIPGLEDGDTLSTPIIID